MAIEAPILDRQHGGDQMGRDATGRQVVAGDVAIARQDGAVGGPDGDRGAQRLGRHLVDRRQVARIPCDDTGDDEDCDERRSPGPAHQRQPQGAPCGLGVVAARAGRPVRCLPAGCRSGGLLAAGRGRLRPARGSLGHGQRATPSEGTGIVLKHKGAAAACQLISSPATTRPRANPERAEPGRDDDLRANSIG